MKEVEYRPESSEFEPTFCHVTYSSPMGLPSTSQNNFASIPGEYTMPEVEVRLIFAESEKYTMHVRKFKNFHGVEIQLIEYLNFLFYIILKIEDTKLVI